MDDDFKQVCAPGWNDDQRAIASDSTEPAAKRNALHRINQRLVVERDRLAAELEARVRELEQTYLAEYQRASAAEAALAAERERVERLREALSKARDMLLRYAHDDEAANGNGYGCYSDPISVVGPFLGVIDAALAQEEAHERD